MADSFVVLLTGIVLTPYTLGGVVDWAHRGMGAALFILQLVLAGQLVTWTHGDLPGVVFLLIQFGGGVIAAVYVLQTEGLLIHGEATFQLGFALVLARTLPRVAPQRRGGDGPRRTATTSSATTVATPPATTGS